MAGCGGGLWRGLAAARQRHSSWGTAPRSVAFWLLISGAETLRGGVGSGASGVLA